MRHFDSFIISLNDWQKHVIINKNGKRKPALKVKGNEAKIEKYVQAFEVLEKKYKGVPYRDAFRF